MKILTTKALGIGCGLTTITGGGITVAYLSSGASSTKPTTSSKNSQSDSITQLPREDNLTKSDLAPKPEPKAVTALLKEANFEIPEKTADNSKWNKQWTVFKEKYQDATLPEAWTLTGWENLKTQGDAPELFRDKCIENGKKTISDQQEAIFDEVKEYCSISITAETKNG